MSTSNGQRLDQSDSKPQPGGFPWFPVLTVVGVAAAAYLLMRKMQGGDGGGLTMDRMLDQCDHAASTLRDRMSYFETDLLAG